MFKQKGIVFNLLELYDQQAKWSMSDDVENDENKVLQHVDDEHRVLNDDVEPLLQLLHKPLHTDHIPMY